MLAVYNILLVLILIWLYLEKMPKIMVFKYHHVAPGKEDGLNYNPETFEKQIKYLIENGYKSIGLDQMYEQLYITRKVEPNQFVVTFDDGFLNNYLYAYPILKKYNVKAVIYLTTSLLDGGDKKRIIGDVDLDENNTAFCKAIDGDTINFLNWEEIKEMEDSGLVDHQPHGHYHRKFYISDEIEFANAGASIVQKFHFKYLNDPNIKPGADIYKTKSSLMAFKYDPYTGKKETKKEAYDRYIDEIKTCKNIIDQKLNKNTEYFSWPWGHFNKVSQKAACDLGLKMHVTSLPGGNHIFTNKKVIKRFNPSRDISKFKLQLKKYMHIIFK